MTRLRLLAAILVALLLTWTLTVEAGDHVGTSPDVKTLQLIAEFGISDSVVSANSCSKYDDIWQVDGGCSEGSNFSYWYATRDWDVALLTMSIHNGWTTNGQCDVETRISGTNISGGMLEVGGVIAEGADFDLSARGGYGERVVSAFLPKGDSLSVRHENPTDATNCIDGTGCTCSGNAGYILRVWGYPA